MRKQTIPASHIPNHAEEKALYSAGYRRVAGLDEAGRGALAGPVVAAAGVLPPKPDFRWLPMVRDSKLLSHKVRENIFTCMQDCGLEIGVGIVAPAVIDKVNILNATRQAMLMALANLVQPPDYLLIDAVTLPGLSIQQKGIIQGDRTVISIACASVVAKVTRDRIMLELDARYPRYKFCRHKGYGTPEHMACLRSYGASQVHRFTYAPVRDLAKFI